MFNKTITVLAGLCMLSSASAAAAAAAIAAIAAPRQSDYVWDVSGLTVHCADNGCSYLFNVKGLASSEYAIPAFNAQCRAQLGPAQSIYRPCEMGTNDDGSPRPLLVEAYFNLDGTNYFPSELSVTITYPEQRGGSYNVTLAGVDQATYNEYKQKPDFPLSPRQISAIP